MSCGCKTQSLVQSSGQPQPDEGVKSPIVFQPYEAYGVNTALDGAQGFWGELLTKPTANLVTVSSRRAGATVTLKLRPLSSDSIKNLAGLNAGDFVFGAYKPDSMFHEDNNSSTALGQMSVAGTLVSIEPSIFSPSLLIEAARIKDLAKHFIYTTTQTDPDGNPVVITSNAFTQLGVTNQEEIHRLLLKYLAAGRTVVLDGRDIIEVYALINSAYTLEMVLNLLQLFREGYFLGKVDAIPGRPGVDTGQVFAVWRLYNPATVEQRTLVQKIDLRKIGDVHIPDGIVDEGAPVDSVDPSKWTPDVCSQCRRVCAKLFVECLKANQGTTGPEAALKYKECMDDARLCYDKCQC